MSDEIKVDKPVIMSKKVAQMIKYHATKEKIVYRLEDNKDETIYMLKSIMRDSQTYNVVNDKVSKTWVCDCPAFKFRKRLNKEFCKHIEFIKMLLAEEVTIDSI